MTKIRHNSSLAASIFENMQKTLKEAMENESASSQEGSLNETSFGLSAGPFDFDGSLPDDTSLFIEGSLAEDYNEHEEDLPIERINTIGMRMGAPVRPVGSNWTYNEEEQKLTRSYDFQEHENLSEFVTFVIGLREEYDISLSVNMTTNLIPGALSVDLEVHRGGSPVAEDERLFTQILDEGYEGAFLEAEQGVHVVNDGDEDVDFW